MGVTSALGLPDASSAPVVRGGVAFGRGTVALGGAATVGCVLVEPCGVFEGIGLEIAVLGGAIGAEDIISQMSKYGRGNQADTGIENEARARFPQLAMCAALDI